MEQLKNQPAQGMSSMTGGMQQPIQMGMPQMSMQQMQQQIPMQMNMQQIPQQQPVNPNAIIQVRNSRVISNGKRDQPDWLKSGK